MAGKKRAYNPKSRENLKQFQSAKHNKAKEDVTKALLDEVCIDESLIDILVDVKEICIGKEEERFMNYVRAYLKEYSKKGAELTISDIDDIATLCMNNIMITRLYKESKKNNTSVADVMAAIDRLKKDNIKLKENLASTRKDRVDPKAGQIVTVSDILEDYERERSLRRRKIGEYEEEENEVFGLCKTSVEDMIV